MCREFIMNYMEEAFAPAENRHKWRVMSNTWGHLAPKVDQPYHGTIIFANNSYGEVLLVRDDFPGMDGNPWYYGHVHDFIGDYQFDEGSEGTLYIWRGTYTMKMVNGDETKGVWQGKTEKLDLSKIVS
jgi:hypothetical protein